MSTSQRRDTAPRPGPRGTERSLARRAELIAIGRGLFADTSYDALSMDDIARQARVAKGLIYYYFRSKRGYYLAIVEDAVSELVTSAAGGLDLAPADRVHRTIDGYLRYAEHHQAAYRTIVSGGVGFDTEVQAIRDGVREAIVDTIAEGAYGSREITPVARVALLSWICGVEGAALDWIARPVPGHDILDRDTLGRLLVKTLGATLRAVEEMDPALRAPGPARRDGVAASREGVPVPREGVPASREGVPAPREGVPVPREEVPASREGVSAPREG